MSGNGSTPEIEQRGRLYRIVWPYHPAYFGIRILETEEDVRDAIFDTTPEPAYGKLAQHVREGGMRLLLLEGEIPDLRTFQRIVTDAIRQGSAEGRS